MGCTFLTQVADATYDLNLRELQFVSDHLTESECRKLSEALSMEDYALDHPVTGGNEKNLSCITLLLAWDRSDNGRARSFHRLSLRLSQIGRKDLSDKLAQLVYDEKSEEVPLLLNANISVVFLKIIGRKLNYLDQLEELTFTA